MSVSSDARHASAPVLAFWYDRDKRAVIYQILLVLAIVFVAWYLISNTLQNMASRNIASGFSFLHRESGFAISEHMIDYSAASTYGRAYVVGILNTLKVSAVGIVLATILGTIIGLARLSSNWLVAKLASVYIETVRNVPLLLQLFLWYGLISTLPGPRQALQPLPDVFLSNRGLKIPELDWHPVYWVMFGLIALGFVIAAGLSRWSRQRQAATGKPVPILWPALGVILGPALAAFLIAGAPFKPDLPKLTGFNFVGGADLSPEFFALLFGLVTYTAAFIAENVRAGILAVAKGQTEAALALGLSKGRVMRMVVLPQALRVIVPPTTSQYLNLTKNSSLAVGIGFPDLVSIANTTMNQTGQAIEGIALIMSVYLTLSLLISLFMNWYNKHIALVER